MVNSLSIIFMVISVLICILMPVILVIYFYKRHKASLLAVLIGALVFVVSQLLIRIPLLSVLGKLQWYQDMSSNIYLIALFLGLTAGLFEEIGRYFAMKLFMKKTLSWKNAVAFGIGHGGIEAIVLVGLTLVNYIVMSFMINSGAFDAMVAATLPAEVAAQIRSMLIDTPVINFLAGGYERMMTMVIQIAFSVMVLYSVKFRKPLYLILAILLHAVVDSPIVILGTMGWNVWAIEGIITLYALAGLVYIIRAKKRFAAREQEEERAQLGDLS